MAQLQTLSKALDILNVLGRSEHLLSVEEIASELELPESTTYRLVQTLEAKGFVQRHSRKKIGLGTGLINLSRDLYERFDRELVLVSTPYLEKICEESKETTILSIRAGLDSKCIKGVSSKHIIRFVVEENRLLRLDIGASSRAILAFEDYKIIHMIQEMLGTDEERALLQQELREIRSQGYAITCNQFDRSAVGIAVPVFNTFGKIYASLAMVGPESRVKEKDYEMYIKMLKAASAEITEKLKQME